MKQLWAPWRMEFIKKSHLKKKSGCIFCDLPKKGPTAKTLVLYKGENAFVILNRYPYSNGHLMVVPNRHTNDFTKLKAAEHREMGELVGKCIEILKIEMKAQGYNVGMNLGDVAGAGIKEHLHYHVVPRWKGDTNFMPIMAGARVLPEALDASYHKLKKYFK
ncbi:MAG: histidine triad (HIT) protein [uncultured bacterium]|nr:MAG: histidine triad (HIT) protein [uncultured bacterium]